MNALHGSYYHTHPLEQDSKNQPTYTLKHAAGRSTKRIAPTDRRSAAAPDTGVVHGAPEKALEAGARCWNREGTG